MKYETPEVDFIIFDENNVFMTASSDNPSCGSDSAPDYSTAEAALQAFCGGYTGVGTNNFKCGNFGSYNEINPPYQNAQVTIGNNSYVFDYKGNHWKLHK